ncbi:OprD family outer membrane porin [Metapseudomonas boanensis]|uniref:OprD family outer membrane porin n=1 Tax=Metapseudomonas boanensis TaxID=2822138 RepID=UPI00203B6DEF|nr:OprD family outer membrane porin [Pseudomonas boanensis]
MANSINCVDFNEQHERSWQARYALNLAALSVPGLTFMVRQRHRPAATRQGRTPLGALYRPEPRPHFRPYERPLLVSFPPYNA